MRSRGSSNDVCGLRSPVSPYAAEFRMISRNRMLASRVRFLASLFVAAFVQSACTDEPIIGPLTSDIAPQLSASANASACMATPANVIGWWRGEGDAVDVTGQHHGVIRGAVTFRAGMVGN